MFFYNRIKDKTNIYYNMETTPKFLRQLRRAEETHQYIMGLPIINKLNSKIKTLKEENRELRQMLSLRQETQSSMEAMLTILKDTIVSLKTNTTIITNANSNNNIDSIIETTNDKNIEVKESDKYKSSIKPNIYFEIIKDDPEIIEPEEEAVEEVEEEAEEEPEEEPEEEAEEEVEEEPEPEEEAVEEAEEEVEEEPEPEEEVEEEVEEEAVEEAKEAKEEEPEPEPEEDEVYEVTINKKIYYTTNEKNGTIYDVDENGDVSIEVGQYKDGKPTFWSTK